MDELEMLALAAAAAKKKQGAASPTSNPDGTYGQLPGEMFPNPHTGQLTSREMLSSAMDPGTSAGAFTRSLGQGATFGLTDEAGSLTAGDEDHQTFQRELDRARLDRDANDHWWASTAGDVTGAIATGAGAAPLAAGKSLLKTAGLGATIGGAEGFAHGFGRGEGGAQSRAGEGLSTAAWTVPIGGAAPYAMAGIKHAANAVKDPIAGLMNMGNQGRANRTVMSALEKSGRTLDGVAEEVAQASTQGQPEFRLMDALGIPGQRNISGLARAGGKPGDDIAAYLAQRQLNQGDRVASFIDDAFETRSTTANQMRDTVKTNRKNVADALFDQAGRDAAPVNTQEAIGMLDQTINQMSNSGIRPPKVVREYQKLRTQLAGKTPEGDPTSLSDFNSVLGLWREVRDSVNKAYKSGDGALGEALKPIRDSLQRSLEEASDLYRFATDNYREGSKVLDAFDTGAQMATRGRGADNQLAARALTEQQQKAARIGYGDAMLNKLERNAAPTANKAKPFSTTKATQEADALAVRPGLLHSRIARENAMWETQNRAMGGSRTADNLADVSAVGEVAGNMLDPTASGGLVARALRAAAPYATGQNDATRQLIAKMMMSRDPKRALASALRSQERGSATRKMIEQALRSTSASLIAANN